MEEVCVEEERVGKPPTPPRATPFYRTAWKAKIACTAGILGYYFVGYFALNRFPFEEYHDVLKVPFLDDLPILPWTVIVYNSVFLLGGLAIWLLPDSRSVGRYFLSVIIAYSLNYLVFALYPTTIDRAPLPEEGSIWLGVMRWMRQVDGPYTCFPSLHITNCVVGVIAFWRTRYGPWFLVWTLAIAVSTLTTDQHLFLDLPAGAFVAGIGAYLAGKLFPLLGSGEDGG